MQKNQKVKKEDEEMSKDKLHPIFVGWIWFTMIWIIISSVYFFKVINNIKSQAVKIESKKSNIQKIWKEENSKFTFEKIKIENRSFILIYRTNCEKDFKIVEVKNEDKK